MFPDGYQFESEELQDIADMFGCIVGTMIASNQHMDDAPWQNYRNALREARTIGAKKDE